MDTGELRRLRDEAGSILGRLDELASLLGAPAARVREAVDTLRGREARESLADIPLDRLRDVSSFPLRLGALAASRYATVLDVLDDPGGLTDVPGVGPATAARVVDAARAVARAAAGERVVRLRDDESDPELAELVVALAHHDDARALALPPPTLIDEVRHRVRRALESSEPLVRMVFRRWFLPAEVREQATRAAGALADPVVRQLDAAAADHVRALRQDPSAATAWERFRRDPARAYAVLASVVGEAASDAAARGHLPAEIAEAVAAQPLDASFLAVSLREYQSFGARYALVQRRVLLGDEMGLGKTIEAIAVMAHVAAVAERESDHEPRFLVVAPASVCENWRREVIAKSHLGATILHGADRNEDVARWLADGGVGITTFETLRTLPIPEELRFDVVVVDEAHYVKNPQARRSQSVKEATDRADRVVFLSGTPMENDVEEFAGLATWLQPGLPVKGVAAHGVAGAEAFRRSVAPVYLRRNQADVLTELPELEEIDAWTEFTPDDLAHYRQAVGEGNFMAMRRAAFAAGDPARSAKLARLAELVADARANERKVVIFSYFRDVLDTCARVLADDRLFGPLTGDVPPGKRQEMVDAFAAAPHGAVLLSQVQAGGVGLNMQCANVVILCEPQVKPTLETQAIARVQRMGQLRNVLVWRLLTADSVDERMREILTAKSAAFDAYARESSVAEATPAATDISEALLAREVVTGERQRLGLEPGSPVAPTH